MPRFRTSLLAAALVGVITVAPFTTAAAAPSPPTGSGGSATIAQPAEPSSGPERFDITLITGDRAQLTVTADGRQLVTIEPAARADGSTPEFHQYEEDGHVYLLPTDVAPLVPQFLDRALFDLTALSEDGYDDSSTSSIPVIVTFDRDAITPMSSVPAVTTIELLESIDGAAARVEKSKANLLANALTNRPKARSLSGAASPLPGVEKIWLDRQVVSLLDGSAPQIGAPQAWQAGLTGAGVTVAVLDSGIDSTHPDLAGAVVQEANFTNDDTTTDEAGHGTHVAGTVAGTGQASDGRYRGIAYEADLLNGKVLDATGSGSMSGVISGMEWAAEQGADIVNMSLGVRGSYTDGTDPASMAVNALTDKYGVLFVISAGNEGGDGRITTPAAAEKALTVGAVDKSNRLAGFSSRGPRGGDFAIKPDVTAPGVGIVAARAAGTDMGNIVDDRYIAMNGTSMAAPHVAGAAALLMQQYPDWSPEEITAALMSTSVPSTNFSVYQQGTGRVAVDRALDHVVFATTDSLSLGHFPYPQDKTEPVTDTITYRNVSDADITLSLSVNVTDERRRAPAAGMLQLAADKVTVPAGGTAEVSLTVNPQVGDYGLYGGWVQAVDEDSGTHLRTAVGFFKETERYDITIRGITRNGAPAGGISNVDVINVDNLSTFARGQIDMIAGRVTVRVPPGNYAVMGFIGDAVGDDLTLAMHPEVSVTKDTTVVLDARTAVPVEVKTAHPTETVDFVVKYHRFDARGRGIGHTYTTNARSKVYVTPTDPVTIGDFEFYTKWTLEAPGEGPSPYLYDLILPESGHVPDLLRYTIDDSNTARVETSFHSHVPDHRISETRSGFRPWESGANSLMRHFNAPHTRTDYVSAGDTRWTQSVIVGSTGPSFYQLFQPMVSYEAGETVEASWNQQVIRPALPPESSKFGPAHRYGDYFLLRIPVWVDSSNHDSHSTLTGDDVTFRIFQNGELITQTPYPEGEFQVGKEPAEYRIELDASRSATWWELSTRTSTAWTFQSAPPPAWQEQVLPLLEVGYDVAVDLLNNGTKLGAQHVGLTVAHQQGAEQLPIKKVRVWASYDDGESWYEAPNVEAIGDGQFQAVIPPNHQPSDAQYISLRVTAADTAGNAVEQEIIKAYRLR
ncbi:MAG TPA: S8 family serine peptidase [Micromonosporaceae bacterium]|nr:S8 family serine peptidase [Micromonosporaceae bacterium]